MADVDNTGSAGLPESQPGSADVPQQPDSHVSTQIENIKAESAGFEGNPERDSGDKDLKKSWRFAASIQYSRLFAKPLKLKTFSADLLEKALLSPVEHLQFLSELFSSLLLPTEVPVTDGAVAQDWEVLLRKQTELIYASASKENPLAGHSFCELTPLQRVDTLYAVCERLAKESPALLETIQQAAASECTGTEVLRSRPIGEDSNGNRYYYYSSNNEDFWVFSEAPSAESGQPSIAPDATWSTACTSLDQIKELLRNLKPTTSSHEAALSDSLAKIISGAEKQSQPLEETYKDRAPAMEEREDKKRKREPEEETAMEQHAAAADALPKHEEALKEEENTEDEEKTEEEEKAGEEQRPKLELAAEEQKVMPPSSSMPMPMEQPVPQMVAMPAYAAPPDIPPGPALAPDMPPAPRPPPRPVMPPRPHMPQYVRGWTPLGVGAPRRRRSAGHSKPSLQLHVLFACSEGDTPDFDFHQGSAQVFEEPPPPPVVRKPAVDPHVKFLQQQAALAARQQAAAARKAAEEARAEEAAANRAHGYSTRKRNATKNFKELYPDLLADDDDEGDEDEKIEKAESEEESSSESGMDSDDSEIGRRRARPKPAPSRPAHQVYHQQQQRRPQPPHPNQQPQQRMPGGQMPGGYSQQQLQQQQQQRYLMQQQQQQQQSNYGGFASSSNPSNSMQQQATLLQQHQQNQQLQQLMQLLSPQEQQLVMQMPAPQRAQTIVSLVQQKRARQAQQAGMVQQRPGQAAGGAQQQRGGLESLGFVPNGAGGVQQQQAGAANRGNVPAAGAGMYQNLGGMRQAAPAPQQGLGLQLPGMLGQQQPQQNISINPFTGGGGSAGQYRGFN